MASSKPDHGQDMFRLVYASRAVLPVLAKFDATVQDILKVSQANNARMGLTGLLIAHKGWFIQTLEGPRRNVSMVFGIIGRDLRHAQLEVMQGQAVEDRQFGRWSMCAHAIAPSADKILKTLDLTPDFDPFTLDADRMLRLMQAISKADPAPERAVRRTG
jgi:hypothetical protein